MITDKVNKKYNIWVMLGLGVASILASLYSIWQGYADFFNGSPSDVVAAVFQILFFDGIISVAVSYIWAIIMNSILTRTLRKFVITRFDFCFYYMFFIAAARILSAVVGAFQFLTPSMAVFCTYLNALVFETAAAAVYFFAVLKRAYLKQGDYAKAFLAFSVPFLIVQALSYLTSAALFGGADFFRPFMSEMGYVLYDDPYEIYAAVAGAVVLALYVGGAVAAYYKLKKSDKDAPPDVPPEISGYVSGKKDEKVFEEFDI